MKDYQIKYYLNSEHGELIKTEWRMCKCDANVLRVIATYAQRYNIERIWFFTNYYITRITVVLTENLPSQQQKPW